MTTVCDRTTTYRTTTSASRHGAVLPAMAPAVAVFHAAMLASVGFGISALVSATFMEKATPQRLHRQAT